jgi:hypothetical protein
MLSFLTDTNTSVYRTVLCKPLSPIDAISPSHKRWITSSEVLHSVQPEQASHSLSASRSRTAVLIYPGKTESVKSLGVQLGRFVLVFCCDETFDFQAMGRIFVGLCQVGAWGCFDEFNRLEERILSAVSQQVQSIQQGLAQAVTNPHAEVELVGKRLKINPRTGE